MLTVYPWVSKVLYRPPPWPGALIKKFPVTAAVAPVVTITDGAAALLIVVTLANPRPPLAGRVKKEIPRARGGRPRGDDHGRCRGTIDRGPPRNPAPADGSLWPF